MEDFDDGLGPDSWEGTQYDEGPVWVNEDLDRIEERQTLNALANPLRLLEDEDDAASDYSQQDGSLATLNGSKTNISVDIPKSTLVAPSYLYEGEKELPAHPEREWRAVQHLLEEHDKQHNSELEEHDKQQHAEDDDFIEFELDKFSIYSEPYVPGVTKNYEAMRYSAELRPLQHLSIKSGCAQLFVDGVLSCGDKRYFVCQVPFEQLPIGNYGVDAHTVGSDIWIRSKLNAKLATRSGSDVYYRLKTPSTEYQRFYQGFLWIVDLAKHVIDYLFAAVEEERDVVSQEFRSDFANWLATKHRGSVDFERWRSKYPSDDFRVAFVANVQFIFKEASGVLDQHKITSMHLWKEILHFTAYPDSTKTPPTPAVSASSASSSVDPISQAFVTPVLTTTSPSPAATPRSKKASPKTVEEIPKTVVTPYIHELFSHLPCGVMLEATSPGPTSDRLRNDVSKACKLELSASVHTSAKEIHDRGVGKSVQVGDVISIPRDSNEESNWVREDSAGFPDVDRWFGLVQRVYKLKDGDLSFDVIWFYRPVDTVCGVMQYPWNNELFLSDHCSCGDGHSKIKQSEVLSVHLIDWGGSSVTDADFFCRQTYLHESRQWVTFQKSHLRCLHRRSDAETSFPYKVGDTVFVLLAPDEVVEPCELLSLPDSKNLVSVRLLYRRCQLQPGTAAAPNELLYSDDTRSLKASLVRGRCTVRFFQPEESILPPYNRNGVGNAFFITHCVRSGQVVQLEEGFTSLRQGFNPSKPCPKLRGVDLFCGGGNFGRGLEEGGVIEMHWANDINVRAIHTYMANTTNPVHPFVGSIDVMQKLALEAKFDEKVPQIGKVDFVAGGSPCPGFSRLTHDKATPEQRKNQSLVAAFASFIDTYRPKFGLLENVVEIVQSRAKKGEDVFCQLICALVGMGYQAHFFLLDAWSYGAPQSRSRVFLCFAAPGYKLPQMPRHTHSHHGAIRPKTLGQLPNGQSMVERLVMETPFKFVSAKEATDDLPDIVDGKPDCCISHPDHRLAYSTTKSFRIQLSLIPMHPYGMNFSTTWNEGEGIMTAAERQYFPQRGERVTKNVSRAWGRSFPNALMQTVTTTPSPSDARIGRLLHWEQNRVFSVMESRRAQGFQDDEVILGTPKDQWQTIGNSVARGVSLALGLSIREALLGSLVDRDEGITPSRGDTSESPQELSQFSQELDQNSPRELAGEFSQGPVLPNNKRSLGSSLEVQRFVSKIAKTGAGQTAGGSRDGSEYGAQENGSVPADDWADDLA